MLIRGRSDNSHNYKFNMANVNFNNNLIIITESYHLTDKKFTSRMKIMASMRSAIKA